MEFSGILAAEFKLMPSHVANVISLIDEGNTIPFIARYRKEVTGAIDDQVLRELSERLTYLRGLESRRNDVKSVIAEQGKLTEELTASIDSARTLAEVEDLYRPYKQKRKTRASTARERGLEPLAALLLKGDPDTDPLKEAAGFIDEEKGVVTAEDALSGARDIIAEDLSDDALIRKQLRSLLRRSGLLKSAAATEEDSVYRMYYDFSEPILKMQGYRTLAVNRGEREGFLRVSLEIPANDALSILLKDRVTDPTPAADEVRAAAEDGYKRLLFPSIEREIRNELTESANRQAIHTFALNLKPLLMQPPIRNRVTMGFDPAYRTGCKIAVIDGTGKLLKTTVVYPTPPNNKTEAAAKELRALIDRYHIDVISLGNGTASRESEQFIAELIKDIGVRYMVVSEAGASVYSASKLAAAEFPDFDVSLRSAVSIARRLQDPLAELVKIDPKSIGVGQYQHDMPPAELETQLIGVVEDCVNAVGVDLNTASPQLLARVAGINAAIAQNIVAHREANGAFSERKQLLKVARLGPKAYEQCAGFLRVAGGKNIFDNTAVHPESYAAAEKLLKLCGYGVADVQNGNLSDLGVRISEKGETNIAEECGIGILTLRDILKELQKPGRDPRDELPPPLLRSDVMTMEDLLPGMELTGTVRNVVDFGAFIDIGVHQDGLVHISRLADRFIKHPSEAVKTGDVVTVWVVEIDIPKNRISLTMRKPKRE